MTRGRPRTAIGTYGEIAITDLGGRYRAFTRYRDIDGRLRSVTAVGRTPRAAQATLKQRLVERPGYGSGGVLSVSSGFDELCALWLADLDMREISEGTKDNYRDDLRLHVRPAFEAYTLGGDHHRARRVVPQEPVRDLVVTRQAHPHVAEPDVCLRAAARRHRPQARRRHLGTQPPQAHRARTDA